MLQGLLTVAINTPYELTACAVPVRTVGEAPLRLQSWRLRFYASNFMFQPTAEVCFGTGNTDVFQDVSCFMAGIIENCPKLRNRRRQLMLRHLLQDSDARLQSVLSEAAALGCEEELPSLRELTATGELAVGCIFYCYCCSTHLLLVPFHLHETTLLAIAL